MIGSVLRRGFAVLLGCGVVAAVLAAEPARAQIVLTVGGEPITALDITHRSKLIQLTTRRQPSRQEVIDELIEEQLKLREAKRWNAVPSDAEVDASFAAMSGRLGLSAQQFQQALAAQGSDARSLRQKIRADMSWGGLVRARFRAEMQVADRDVSAALTTRNTSADAQKGIEYQLRQIVFVVPRGSGDAVVDQRRREAEALRGRFQSCEEGLPLARGLRDVVVREPILRAAGELTPGLRELFANTADGRLTPPERTDAGVEVVAVCSRREVSSQQSAAKTDVRQELMSERMQAASKRYLADLRRQALIEYR